MKRGLTLSLLLTVFFLGFVSADVFINEFVVDPQTDWDGSGSATNSDEWIELYNSGTEEVDLTDWILDLIDGTDVSETLSGVIASEDFLVILNPTGQQNNNGMLVLTDDLGAEVDSVSYGSFDDGNVDDNAPSGNSDGVDDECVARISDGLDSNVDIDDFVKTECTFGATNGGDGGEGEPEPPECVIDLDCGEDVFGEPMCLDGDVQEMMTTHSCVDGSCVVEEEDVLVEECGELGCLDGECIIEEAPELECIIDLDCGEDSVSEPFCADGEVIQTETIHSCVENMCVSDDPNVLIEECEFGCEEGGCLLEPQSSEGLSVFSPLDGAIYDDRIVLLDVLYEGVAKSLKYGDNDERFRRLCKWCDSYSRTRAFSEGSHELMVKAFDVNGAEVIESVNFIVDVRDPKIRYTFPVRGFASGRFMVEFKEMHPVELILHYGVEGNMNTVGIDLDLCEERRTNMLCNFDADLSEFDGERIMYWFSLSDIVGGFDESSTETVWVDSTKPVVDSFSYEIIGRSLRVMIDITEDNFGVVQYKDNEDRVPRYRTLCSGLRDGTCNVKKFFSRGEHLVDIRVLDMAGNEALVVEGLGVGV